MRVRHSGIADESREQFMTAQPRPRAVYIAGLSRSGSTILQRYLATHPELVSIGESLFTLRVLSGKESLYPDWPCSCGRSRNDCEFWGPLLSPLANTSLERGLPLLLERFHSLYPRKVLVDSSKDTKGLELCYLKKARAGEIELDVIFLVRDVRSWATAVRKYRTGRSSFVLEAYRWMKATLNMLRVLRSAGINCYCLSYESFVFDPAQQTEKLAQWLNVENRFSTESLAQASTHELFGSPTVRLSAGKRERLVYDGTWLRDWGPALFGPLILPPLLVNRYVLRSLAGKPMRPNPPAIEKTSTAVGNEPHST